MAVWAQPQRRPFSVPDARHTGTIQLLNWTLCRCEPFHLFFELKNYSTFNKFCFRKVLAEQPRICSGTPMGYSVPHQRSRGAAACCLLYMLTRAILMPSLFHRLFQKQALARGHYRGRGGDDSLAFFGAEFETNRKVGLSRGNV